MNIRVKDAPLGHKFTDDKVYPVYGVGGSWIDGAFVFDDDCEACFLGDLDWEEVVSE